MFIAPGSTQVPRRGLERTAWGVPLEVLGCALGRVGGAEVGAVAAEHLDPLLAGVVEVVGDEVGGVVLAAAGHARRRPTRRWCARRAARWRGADGVALDAVDGGGVGELDVLARVVGGQRTAVRASAACVTSQLAVAVDAGDGPGVAVGDAEVAVVAAGRDPVPDTDPLAGAVVTVARSSTWPAATSRSRIAALRAATCSRVSATTTARARRERCGGASASAAMRSASVGWSADLAAGEQRVEHLAGAVLAGRASRRRRRVARTSGSVKRCTVSSVRRARVGPSGRRGRARRRGRPRAAGAGPRPARPGRRVSSAMVSSARAVSWSSIPASSTSSRSPGAAARSSAGGVGVGSARVRRVQCRRSSQRKPCW